MHPAVPSPMVPIWNHNHRLGHSGDPLTVWAGDGRPYTVGASPRGVWVTGYRDAMFRTEADKCHWLQGAALAAVMSTDIEDLVWLASLCSLVEQAWAEHELLAQFTTWRAA